MAKRGRKPKRRDADDSPVDGDYSRDQVVNREPGKSYAFVLPGDDMAKYVSAGAVRTERREGGAAPRFDDGGGDGGYVINGQLVLMELPEEKAEAMQRGAERRFARNYQGHKESITQTRTTSLGSLGPDPSTPMSYRATA